MAEPTVEEMVEELSKYAYTSIKHMFCPQIVQMVNASHGIDWYCPDACSECWLTHATPSEIRTRYQQMCRCEDEMGEASDEQ